MVRHNTDGERVGRKFALGQVGAPRRSDLDKFDTSSAEFTFYPQAHPVERGDKKTGGGRRASPRKPNLPQQDGLHETTTKNQSGTNVFAPARRSVAFRRYSRPSQGARPTPVYARRPDLAHGRDARPSGGVCRHALISPATCFLSPTSASSTSSRRGKGGLVPA